MPRSAKRTRKRKCGYALLILLALGILARSTIVRYAVVEAGSRILQTRLEVAGIYIGLSSIRIDGIQLFEPHSGDTQMSVRQVAIQLTPWKGIRGGTWAEQVFLGEPTLHLRFDRDGELISRFPSSESSESDSGSTKIPIAHLRIKHAMLVIHQTGKEPFAVENIDLVAAFADDIRLQAGVPDLLGGKLEINAAVDARTLQGQSKMTIDGVHIDTARLVKLPLVPASIHDEPWTAMISASLEGDHPADELDFRKHELQAIANVRDVNAKRLGTLCHAFDVHATHQAGHLALDAQGDLVDGTINLRATCDSSIAPLTATAVMAIRDLNVGRLSSCVVPDHRLESRLNVQTHADIELSDGLASFNAKLGVRLAEIQADGVALSDVITDITSTGQFALDDLSSLHGDLNGALRSDGVNLAAIATRFQVPKSQGDIGLSSNFHVSLADLPGPKAVTLDLSINSTNVTTGDFRLEDNTARMSVKDGVAIAEWSDVTVVDSEATRMVAGSVSARVPLDATETLSGNLSLSLAPTPSLARLVGIEDGDWGGFVTTNAAASCVVGDLTRPEAWKSNATFASRELRFAGEAIANFHASLEINDGRVTLPSFPIQWRDNILHFAANGSVGEPAMLGGQIVGEHLDLSNAAELAGRFSSSPMPLSGYADLEGQFRVATNPFDFVASGSSTLRDAFYAQSKIGQASIKWSADGDGIRLHSSSNQLMGGSFDLVANAKELDWTRTVVEGRFENVQSSRLAAIIDRNLPVTGSFDGGLSVTSIASLETLAGRVWLTSRGVSVHRVPLEIKTATISIQSSELTANLSGTLADGSFQSVATGRLQELKAFVDTPDRNISRVPIVTHGELVDLPIESLTRHIRLPDDMRTLGGKLSATLDRDFSMHDGRSLATASASVSELRLNRVRLSDRILGEVSIHGDRIELRRIDGRFADGRLSGKAEVRLGAIPSGTFDFAATRVNLRRASAALARQPISGSGTIQLRGRIGQVISGRADVSLSHGVLAGVSVTEASFPVDWSYSQPSKTARWQCRAGMVSAGGGTIRVASEGSLGSTLNMTTSARIERVDSSKLMQGKSSGAGIISGTVNLQAKRARAPKQFTGNYKLTLASVKSLEIPVLDQLPKMVSLSPSRPGRGEDGGTVRGRIAGGLVHVDELAIAQSNVQVLMSGNATLDGRLNFDLTASTQSNGPADQLLALADSPLMLAAPAPIALVAKANDLLKDRVVHVHVGGNASRPTIRMQPGKQLSQDAVQFFLKSSFGNAPLSAVSQSSQSTRR